MSAIGMCCNILLLWIVLAIAVESGRGIHPPTTGFDNRGQTSLVIIAWCSFVGVVLSLVTVVLTVFSEESPARWLCVFGSMLEGFCWVVAFISIGGALG